MEKIARLARMIREETQDAGKYAKCALSARDLNPQECRTFADIANQELGHADKLHAMAVACIEEANRQGREAPAGMERVWEFEHERIVEDTAAVRNLLMMLG